MSDLSELPKEDEKERLSRECREMYDELVTRGAITGTYAEWLEAAAKQATEPPEQPRIQVVRS